VHLEVGLAGADLAALVADPFGLVEVDGVHVVLEVGAVGEGLLAQRALGHELGVAAREDGLEVDGAQAVLVQHRDHLARLAAAVVVVVVVV